MPNRMAVKAEMNPVRGIRTFPAFPLVLGVVGKEERNIITLSLVHVFSFNPPLIGVGISPSRHSHELFHRSPDFSINIPPKELVEESIFCGEKSGKDMDNIPLVARGRDGHGGRKMGVDAASRPRRNYRSELMKSRKYRSEASQKLIQAAIRTVAMATTMVESINSR